VTPARCLCLERTPLAVGHERFHALTHRHSHERQVRGGAAAPRRPPSGGVASARVVMTSPGRNNMCPYRSGAKNKRCCLGRDRSSQRDSAVADAPDGETLWSLRSIRGPAGKAHLAFGACSRCGEDIRGAFSTWVQLRHHDLQQITGELESLITGVLLTPRADQRRPLDTTMCAVAGELKLPADELSAYRNLWPTKP
jgi:hypothetical protein